MSSDFVLSVLIVSALPADPDKGDWGSWIILLWGTVHESLSLTQTWEHIQGEIKGRLPRSPSSNFSSVNSHGARIVHLWAPLLISRNTPSVHLSHGFEPITTAYLSRTHGAYLPLLSTKLLAMVCSKHPILTSLFSFCCCFSVLLKQRIRTCQTGNAAKHFRKGVNEGLLLYSVWHLLSCWTHAQQWSLICSLLKI